MKGGPAQERVKLSGLQRGPLFFVKEQMKRPSNQGDADSRPPPYPPVETGVDGLITLMGLCQEPVSVRMSSWDIE
jgi:hypothetical protein